jgi:hypothetical protein
MGFLNAFGLGGPKPESTSDALTINPENKSTAGQNSEKIRTKFRDRLKKVWGNTWGRGLLIASGLIMSGLAFAGVSTMLPKWEDMPTWEEGQQWLKGVTEALTSGGALPIEAASVAPLPAEVVPPPSTEVPQPSTEQVVATPEQAAPSEKVAEYTLTDSDGITQAVMKLKAELGDAAPEWLKDIKTPQDVAEWARLNNFYTPDQVQDSIIMHKGDVLSIDKFGNLSITNPDGSVDVLTDGQGRATPNALGNRDFSDSVPTELPDDRVAQLQTYTAVINNPPVESFAGQNPWPVDSTEYRAWEGMRDFISTHATGDSWKTSDVPVSDYLSKLTFAK